MKNIILKASAVVIALAISALSLVSAFAADINITAKIDMDKTYQVINGFGAGYSWYGERLTQNENAETAYDWIFEDCGINILRFIDFNGHPTQEEATTLKGYPMCKSVYDAAVSRGINPLVMVSSCGFCKSRDFAVRSHDDCGDTGKAKYNHEFYTLRKNENGEYDYEAFARFCVQSVQYFFDAGIPVHVYSLLNEVENKENTEYIEGQPAEDPGMFFAKTESEFGASYAKAHMAVYEAFQEAFGEHAPIVIGAETMFPGAQRLEEYLGQVEDEMPEALEIVGYHLYGGRRTVEESEAIRDAFPNHIKWQTEWNSADNIYHAQTVLRNLVYADASAYIYWNGVWADDGGCCLIEAEGGNLERNTSHYVMQHFAKYILPGYIRVDCGYASEQETGLTTMGAFKSPDGSKLVVVASNCNELETDCSDSGVLFDIGGKEILKSTVYQTVALPNPFYSEVLKDEPKLYCREHLVNLGEYDVENGLTLPANSVTTVVFELEADKEYEEIPPVIEHPLAEDNPYVNYKKGTPAAIWYAAAGVGAIAAAAVIIIAVKRKRRNKAEKAAE